MAIEIERKFLLKDDSWREHVSASLDIQQAYFNRDDEYSIRVRIQEETANLNIKSKILGMQRHEYEYDIPLVDALEMLNRLPKKIQKKRHIVKHAGHTWEVDEFYGDNAGLIVAEIELNDQAEVFEIPDWCAQEVTYDKRFYNVALVDKPYKYWVSQIDVWTETQTLNALNPLGECILEYLVSTAKNGCGELKNSECTPRGLHQIRAKIGAGEPLGSAFVSRRPTGEIWSAELNEEFPNRDWILSRIMWLSGCEKTKNRLGDVDSMQRYIYIHGTPTSEPLGVPLSHGCIRMRNEDVIELFEHCFVGTTVMIYE